RAILPERKEPGSFGSESPGFQDVSFQRYVESVHDYPPGSFDVIVVDGRARNACLRAARKHVKPGGLIVLDNSDRSYDEGKSVYTDCEKRTFFGLNPYQLFPGETTAWKTWDDRP